MIRHGSEGWHEALVDSPFGRVRVAVTERGVLAAGLDVSDAAFRRDLVRRLGPGAAADEGQAEGTAARHLERARAAIASADPKALASPALPLDGRGLSDWDLRVFDAARRVPAGTVTSYGRLARAAGAPGAARAAGGTMGRNPFWLLVPCHRVVRADGTLGGYGRGAWSLELKEALLAREGVSLPAAGFWG
jgi:O-6-methylguanine DNA methyltransferase